MKTKIFIILFGFFSFTMTYSQVCLKCTKAHLKEINPDNTFTWEISNDGSGYLTSDFKYGTWKFYFNSDSIVQYCVQIPFDNNSVNAEIKRCNETYTIISETTWIASLYGTRIMDVALMHDIINKNYYFTYSWAQ